LGPQPFDKVGKVFGSESLPLLPSPILSTTPIKKLEQLLLVENFRIAVDCYPFIEGFIRTNLER
jgi:hypothetical protein